jgi:ribosomal protein S6--L-glutamate ligase
MRIGIFSRNLESEDRHENELLFEAIDEARHEPVLIQYGPETNAYTDLTQVEIFTDIQYDFDGNPYGVPMPEVDVVIPRVNETTDLNLPLNALRAMAARDIPLTASPDAIRVAKDKAQTLLELSVRGIDTPHTILPTSVTPPNSDKTLRVVQPNLYGPVAIKKTHGTIGRGTKILDSVKSAKGVLDDNNEPAVVQEFIKTPGYPEKVSDMRILVVGGKAREWYGRETDDDFRDNLYLGQDDEPNAPKGPVSLDIDPSNEQKKLAVNATAAVGLEVAGVDIFESPDGFLLVNEINASPGFGIDEVKARNIARLIIEHSIIVANQN